MCLGVPGLVTEVDELTAVVDFWGVRRRVRLDLVDEPVNIGDYVLNHVGFAIRRIPPEDVQTTLQMYEQLLAQSKRDDLMAADVRGEIQAGQSEPSAQVRGAATVEGAEDAVGAGRDTHAGKCVCRDTKAIYRAGKEVG